MATKIQDFRSPSRERGQRGKKAEEAVHRALKKWQQADPAHREFSRLLDTRAAQRIVRKSKADFEYFSQGQHGLLEVKETEHDFRFHKSKITQLADLWHRNRCGGQCFVLIHHSKSRLWRCIHADWFLANPVETSWDFSIHPLFTSAEEALKEHRV